MILVNIDEMYDEHKYEIRNFILSYDVKYLGSFIFQIFDEDKRLLDYLEDWGIRVEYNF